MVPPVPRGMLREPSQASPLPGSAVLLSLGFPPGLLSLGVPALGSAELPRPQGPSPPGGSRSERGGEHGPQPPGCPRAAGSEQGGQAVAGAWLQASILQQDTLQQEAGAAVPCPRVVPRTFLELFARRSERSAERLGAESRCHSHGYNQVACG